MPKLKPAEKSPGQLMREARAAAKPPKTQADIAETLGLSQPLIARWEADEASPSSGHLRAVAAAYDLEIEQLLP